MLFTKSNSRNSRKINLFKSIESVEVREKIIDDNNIDLIIEDKEKQTGTFNAGVSVGTIDGFAIVLV